MEPMKRTLTCIICPRGCQLTVECGEDIQVTGNLCPRGKTYAIGEITDPRRTVTSTVRCSDGGVVAVKTSAAIPKAKISDCMALINTVVAKLPVRVGDVLIPDILHTGVDLVVTQNRA